MINTTGLMITSFKGGVGKSTITANLAIILAGMGKRVLAVDCDFNMRCLDIIMGLEDYVEYDISDVCCRSVPLSKAVIQDSRSENLFFCPAPFYFNGVIDKNKFCAVMDEASDYYKLDYILFDTPGDFSQKGSSFLLGAVIMKTDMAMIVATHQPASIRAAERTGVILGEMGVADRRLIINSFDVSAVKKGIRPGIIEIIDRTCIQLIGVIPYDKQLSELQENGTLVDAIPNTDSAAAFKNIANRLEGKNIPLFTSFGGSYKTVVLK